MKKKIIFITIIVIIIASVSALVAYLIFIKKVKNEQKDEKILSTELNVCNWEGYFDPEIIKEFEEKYGININLKTYDDENTMFSMVQSDLSKCDFAIASGALVEEMIALKLLAPLDFENIPNLKNISENFKNPSYDSGNKYSLPYLWGTTGIVVNRKYIEEDIDSWEIMWKPEYKGKIAMLNDYREVVGAALKSLGYSMNSHSIDEILEAEDKLQKQKPLLAGYFGPTEVEEKFESEEIWISQLYNGDAIALMENEDLDIEYIIPAEGTSVWVDNMIIPKEARHKYTSEVFINYLQEPEVSAKNTNYNWYASPNFAAEQFIDKEILEDEAIYPQGEIMNKLEKLSGVGDITSEYNKVWSNLQE